MSRDENCLEFSYKNRSRDSGLSSTGREIGTCPQGGVEKVPIDI